MNERSNRERVEKAFRDWQDGTGYITDLYRFALLMS